MPSFSFSKNEKLCGEIRIGKLFSEGKAFIVFPLRVVFLKSDEHSGTSVKVMISVPKKKIRKAVDRNRIKRLIREAYRINKPAFVSEIKEKDLHLHIAFTYVSDKESDFSHINEKIHLALGKILNTFNEEKETK